MDTPAFGWARLSNDQRASWFFWIGMVLIGVVSVYKAFFGFGGYDESFYLTIGDRIAKGDSLFADEWNLAQTISVFIAPIMAAYKRLVGSYAGVILFSRMLYVVLHALTCIFAFRKVKRYGCMAVAGVLSLFLFTPFNIMALCYNTMTIDFLVIATLLLATSENRPSGIFVSGMFFACAVMCYPYLALAYAAYLLAAIALRAAGRIKNRETHFLFKARTMVLFTLGASLIALLLAVFVLGRASIGSILENIPLMLADPEHASAGIWGKTRLYFESIFKSSKYFKIPLSAFGIVAIAMALDRARSKHRAVYLSAVAATTLLAYLSYAPRVASTTFNHIMFPMLFMGIASYCLLDNKPKELFCTTFLAGIIYGFCASLASNQSFYVISSATVVANVAGFVFVGKLLEEMKIRPDGGTQLRSLAFILARATVVVLFALQFASRLNHCFWDQPRYLLDATIEEGPGAGIATTKENAAVYHSLHKDISSCNPMRGEKLLVLSEKTYLYLMADGFEYATLSPWLGGGETLEALDRLALYYQVHPEKVPTFVFIPKESTWDFDAVLPRFADAGYLVHETGTSYQLRKRPSRETNR